MVISVILRFFELAFVGQLKPSFVDAGHAGRAGRSGEAITLYTEEDIPFLRNIANLMKNWRVRSIGHEENQFQPNQKMMKSKAASHYHFS